jgi:hypothetical protein
LTDNQTPRPPTIRDQAPDRLTHDWVAAAIIPLDDKLAPILLGPNRLIIA